MNRFGIRGRNIELYVQFTDANGDRINTDDTPTVAIWDSTGTLRQAATNMGVGIADDPGVYVCNYLIPENGPDGYWIDIWTAKIGNDTISTPFRFWVSHDGYAEESTEPIYEPGGEPGVGTGEGESLDFTEAPFKFTKEEMEGINILLQLIKPRLKNDGIRKVPDGAGGYINVPCNVFTNAELIAFLVNSLSEFNQIPHFTQFLFSNPQIYTIFADVIVQGAVLLALAAQALIEKGREFVITDNGVTYQPPAVSEILNSQYTAQLADYTAKVKMIKCSLKPAALGLGSWRVEGTAPAFRRLRHLRQHQII